MGLLQGFKRETRLDVAAMQAMENLQMQIADLEAQYVESEELANAQAARVKALEKELEELKSQQSTVPSQGASEASGRVAPWSIW